MAKIRITKEFRLEMAHFLYNYNGLCKNIHGHSYILNVTIIGEPENKAGNNSGMVIDFAELKNIVEEEIVSKFDHSVVVNSETPNSQITELRKITSRCIVVDFQPTCENLLFEFAEKIKKRLPENVNLFALKLNETAGSYAEWYANDNFECSNN